MILSLAVGVVIAAGAEKSSIGWEPPPTTDDDRPLIAKVSVTAQGTDYAVALEFDKPPYGAECKNRCANATVFLDTDNNKATGLKLSDTKAAETGADLAVTVQGTREVRNEGQPSDLKITVKQFAEDATTLDQATVLIELDPHHDSERVTVNGNAVSILVDANVGNQAAGKKLRMVYHPPDHAALVAVTSGLAAGPTRNVEFFKGNRRANPSKSNVKSP